MRPQYANQSIQRSLNILDAFLDARQPLSLEQICAKVGLPKSTAYRIVLNLIQGGFLQKSENGYWLGMKLLRFGSLVEEQLNLKEVARPHLQQLRDSVNETIYLAVLDDELRVFYLEKFSSHQAVTVLVKRSGSTAPIHCTGLGKAMAAFLPKEVLVPWLENHDLEKYTDTTITEKDAFLRHLEEIRARGYSIDMGEHQAVIRCVGVPIRNNSGEVISALSIALPETRTPDPLIGSDLAQKAVATGAAVSLALGYTGHGAPPAYL